MTVFTPSRRARGVASAVGALLLAAALAAPGLVSAQDRRGFDEFKRKQAAAKAGASANVSVGTKSKSEAEEAEKIALGDVPAVRLAGIVEGKALSVPTLRERAKARMNPGIENMLVPEDYEAAVKKAEHDILYEWAPNVVLAMEARKRGYGVAPAEVELRLQELADAADMPGDPEGALALFKIRLEDFRLELEDAILMEKLVLARIDELYGEGELRAIYDANAIHFHRPRRVHLLAIVQDLATARTEADYEALYDQMERAEAAVKKGRDFGDVAREFSGSPISRSRGGDLGWLDAANELPAPFNGQVFDLVVGKATKILESSDGRFLYIFKVLEKRPEERSPFEESRDEVKLIVFDGVKAALYEETRRNYKVVLNPGGIPDKYLEKVDVAALQVM
jgi:hypothetical protein